MFQENLFGMDIRSEKEKNSDAFKSFVRGFLVEHEISMRFPKAVEDKLFFPTLRNLFVSHVAKGSWDEELFALSALAVIEQGKKLSTIALEQEAAKINSDNDNYDSSESKDDYESEDD